MSSDGRFINENVLNKGPTSNQALYELQVLV